MKSNIYELNGKTDLRSILDDIELIAKLNKLEDKQKLRLVLLSEELVGMLPNLLEYCNGQMWIENEGNDYTICVSVTSNDYKIDWQDRLLAVSSSGENQAHKGIMGKIREAVDIMFGYDNDITREYARAAALDYGFISEGMINSGMNYYQTWSLNNYKDQVSKAYEDGKLTDEWDELEKSIIAKLADDVLVGIKGKKVDIIVKKKF